MVAENARGDAQMDAIESGHMGGGVDMPISSGPDVNLEGGAEGAD